VLYLTLSLLGPRIKEGSLRSLVEKLNSGVVEAKIEQEVDGKKVISSINSLD
jgi:hypothetical protein